MATYSFDSTRLETREGQRSLLSRTFLYMFVFLAITTVVSIGLSIILQKNGLSTDVSQIPDSTRKAYQGLMIGSSISTLVLVLIITFTSLRPGKASIIPMFLYSVCMGVTISSFSLYLKWWTIAMAFGIAALAFGAMALIGVLSKNASGLGMVGYGIIFAVAITTLFNLLFSFLLPFGVWGTMNIITSSLIVVAIMLITVYDVWKIKMISERGVECDNLALYLAFTLYLDFILILIHLLRYLAIFASDN